jgi:iron complex transport system permease protein
MSQDLAARPTAAHSGMGASRVFAVLAAATLVGIVLSLAVGAKSVPLHEVWTALASPTGTPNDIIVRELRIPRTALAVLVGAALALSGALIQGHTRNPLADPGLLGVSAGAALAVVVALSFFSVTSTGGTVWFALVGALAASLLVFGIGSVGTAGATPVTLAIAGAAISALLGAITTTLLLLDQASLDAFRFWAVGSVAGRDLATVAQVAPFLLVGLVLAVTNIHALNSLALGEDLARALGVHVTRARVVGVASVTLLTGAAVAACGPVAFVGLIVPHMVRALVGPDHRVLVPASALAGAAFLLLADVVGRVVVRPGELQVGIVAALVGAPFFIALVRRRRLVNL